MSSRNDVPPGTVGVDLREEGVEVEYLDGRQVLYRGVPEPVTETLVTPPGAEAHVLVTDPMETEGVMIYVNDLRTHDDILQDSGVGRVILEQDEEETLFPGITVRQLQGERVKVEADPDTARGRVFVFVENERGEVSYEFIGETQEDRKELDQSDGPVEENTGG